MNSIVVKGGHAGRINIDSGQVIEIINLQGKQVCDFFAFSRDNIRETLSPGHTRSVIRRLYLNVDDNISSVIRTPMFTLIQDDVGINDFCMPACDPQRYILDFNCYEHRSCRQNLRDEMTEFDIPYEYLPDPFNFFQPTPIQADGRVGTGVSPAKPGDKVVLRALMGAIVVVSACPQDFAAINNHDPTDLELRVLDA